MNDDIDEIDDDQVEPEPERDQAEKPLTASEFKEILASVTTGASDDASQEPEPDSLDDYTPEGIASRAAPIATEAATRAVLQRMNAINSFSAQVKSAAAKALGDYDIPEEMINSTINEIVTAYPDEASLKQILDSKSYLPLLNSKVGELALQGKLKKAQRPPIAEMTPTSAQTTSTVEKRAEDFRQAFKREPSKSLQDKWRSENS